MTSTTLTSTRSRISSPLISAAGLRRRALALASAAAVVTASAVVLTAGPPDGDRKPGRAAYAIGLWGDLPYSPLQAETGVPNLIADMNAQRLAFSVHDGDLKQGSNSPCDEALYAQSLAFFNALESPAMFTPGDNDWTDCDRPSNGGYSSLERLDHERRLFFNTPYSLGQRPMRQAVQIEPLCLGLSGMVPCVENRRWTVGGVVYVTLNIQGSCNNLCDTAPDPLEYDARNQANIAWMRTAFAAARARRASAVMIISQGNPGFDTSDPTRAPLRNPRTLAQTDGLPDGFRDFLVELRKEVVAFGRPVAYVHGDSHYFRVDRPLLDEQGQRLETFLRIETFGNNPANGTNDVQWVKVLVDPDSREVFAVQPQVVPANRTAVPLPSRLK
ncbi:MAG: hypothetical protein AB7N65_14790 [Vicinamibacterales bacterium]